MNKTYSSMLLLEINEVNRDVLAAVAANSAYKNIASVLQFNEIHTLTNDTDESGFLEPWVQWVSIHTGVPSEIHGIKHLSSVPDKKNKQIWEVLGKHGITSGVWGVMNGSKKDEENCLFFLPDPWTANEKAYPESVDKFAGLARYISRNYLNLSIKSFAPAFWGYFYSLLRILSPMELMQSLRILAEGLLSFGPTKLVMGAFFEFTSACAFLNFKRSYNPRFSILFLNLAAHAQHNYWQSKSELSEELLYAMRVIDLILGKILSRGENAEALLIANGLSQVNTTEEEPWILYRQIDHGLFLEHIGVKPVNVEALMTYDAFVYFANKEDCQYAISLLSEARIEGEKLLYVEPDSDNACKLFYRIAFIKEVGPETIFSIGSNKYRFFESFQKIVKRTGKHSQAGFVMFTKLILPPRILNHELTQYILHFFEVEMASNLVTKADI